MRNVTTAAYGCIGRATTRLTTVVWSLATIATLRLDSRSSASNVYSIESARVRRWVRRSNQRITLAVVLYSIAAYGVAWAMLGEP